MKLRLFFALWPDDAVCDALAAAARPLLDACRGRQIPKRNYHLTLAFLGGVADERLDAICAAAATVRASASASAFDLELDVHGHWRGPRVAWLGCSNPPVAAQTLADTLWTALAPIGFAPDPRPFRPHLTVLRGCRACEWPGPVSPVSWPVRDFALVRSETLPEGPRYSVLARWPLDAATAAGRSG